MKIATSRTRTGDITDLYEKLPASRAYIDEIAARSEKSKQQSVAGLRALLFLLKAHGTPAAPLILKREESGKPYFENSPLEFGISHSGELAVCALSDKPVGIDVEKVREIRNVEALSARFLSERERYYVTQSSDKSRAFLEIWTKKEAYLKESGVGLNTDLTKADVFAIHTKTLCFTECGEEYIIGIYGDDDTICL